MTEREPVERSTRQLIADGRARQEALASVDTVLAEVRGTAYDNHGSIKVTVDGRGKLLELWLRPDAVRWGPEQLGRLIVLVAEAAMDQATQAGYNRLAPLLGDSMTYAIEMLSGRAAPARRDTGPGITAEEFQRRRDERMHAHGGASTLSQPDWTTRSDTAPSVAGQGNPLPGAGSSRPADGNGTGPARVGRDTVENDGFDPDDPLSFDLSSLRSDR
ncbi:YbaB/EbfC family nucleoid-associated protein [Actinokineospora enzanensis]|uniref:YbaB/EbfC family nucleoid-associated protein n=1 Tax=Actinokineospora enzanensis TaxID=155975 RepID=UPI00035D75C9|nr:YbaB/EbfC family nucleoid-associated protein [Actinokineospora enzanensis]